jgi:hypothetical protein
MQTEIDVSEVAEVIAFHPYRTMYPWQHGGRLLMRSDYQRGELFDVFEEFLIAASSALSPAGHKDNHHGYTFRTYSGITLCAYFSDWRFSLFLMPDAPASTEDLR